MNTEQTSENIFTYSKFTYNKPDTHQGRKYVTNNIKYK